MPKITALPAALALALAGCATGAIGPAGLTIPTQGMPGYELAGHRLRAVNVDRNTATTGAVNIVTLRQDGVATSTVDGSNRIITGRWGVRGQQLCFSWPVRGLECWPYPTAMTVGQTLRVTSDRGVTADVTLLKLEA